MKIGVGRAAVVMVVGLIGMVVFTGCGTSSVTNNNTSEPKLVMATSADYPPYEYHDLSGGTDQIKGFDVDVANAISQQLGFTFTIKDMKFDGLIGALQAHRADFVMAGMVPTEDRKKNVDFSMSYYEFTNAIVSKKGSSLTTPDALKGKSIAAQIGTTQQDYAETIPGAKVIPLDLIPAVVQAVKSGRVDAAIISEQVAKTYVQQENSGLQLNKLPKAANSPVAIAFPKGSEWVGKFNQALTKMKENGQLDALIKKWFENAKTN